MSLNPGVTRSLFVTACAATALAAGATGAAGSAAAPAHAAKTCKAPKYPSTGYFTSLSVTHVSCDKGKKLILAYYKCRTKTGPAGKCTSKVLGFSCTEKRNAIPTEIDARVTCKHSGGEKVVHTYQQDI